MRISVCLALFLFVSIARADDYETFHYKKGGDKDWLRAILEDGFVLGLGFIDNWRMKSHWTDWDKAYSWPFFRKKLVGEEITFDSNLFTTNFIGHPVKGTLYYSLARSNRLSVFESAAFAIVTSTTFEFLGEADEEASINDMIVTPVAGVAIGEAFTQIASYFDRQPPTLANRIFGTIFGPFKTAHDFIDGAVLDRCAESCGPWHRFDLVAKGGVVAQEHETLQAVFGGGVSARTINLPDWDAPGRHAHAFADGNVTRIGLSASATQNGLLDFHALARAVPLGWHLSDSGYSAYVGGAVGIDYRMHDWGDLPLDHLCFITIGPSGGMVVRSGGFRFEAEVDALVGLAAVTALALPFYRGPLPLTSVIQNDGYDFSFGLSAAPIVTLAYGPFELGARARVDVMRGFQTRTQPQTPPPVLPPRYDQIVDSSAWLDWAPIRNLRVGISGRASERLSTFDAIAVSRTELELAGGAEVRF
jgi:hypothetical protein